MRNENEEYKKKKKRSKKRKKIKDIRVKLRFLTRITGLSYQNRKLNKKLNKINK